jgi:predicted RNase H-like HicB family nuclease
MKLKIILEKGEDGYIVAHCPALKGCWSQGKTEEEALENIKEAILLYLEPEPSEIHPSFQHKVIELSL